jgi:hypothetical protein
MQIYFKVKVVIIWVDYSENISSHMLTTLIPAPENISSQMLMTLIPALENISSKMLTTLIPAPENLNLFNKNIDC